MERLEGQEYSEERSEMLGIYAHNPVIVLREEFDDWAVLYNPDTSDAIGINSIGVDIWKKLNTGKSIIELLREMQSEYDNFSQDAEIEVFEFIRDLRQRNMLIH